LTRAKWIRIGYLILIVFAISFLLPNIYCWYFNNCAIANFLSSYLAAYVLMVIPVGLLLLWVLNFKCRKEHSASQRLGMVFANIFLMAPFIIFFLFSAGFYIFAAYPNFYLGRQGPDTKYAIQGFSNIFGSDPPESVSRIYFRSHGFEDNHTIFRFHTSDAEFVRKLINQKNLIESERQKKIIYRKDYPGWWLEKENHGALKFYSKINGASYTASGLAIWYNPTLGIVWYEYYDT